MGARAQGLTMNGQGHGHAHEWAAVPVLLVTGGALTATYGPSAEKAERILHTHTYTPTMTSV